MLPEKIRKFVVELFNKTNAGNINWQYLAEDACVIARLPRFNVEIEYHFDLNEEIALFRLIHTSNETGSSTVFVVKQFDKDYDDVRSLYEAAQACDLDTNLE